LALRGRPGSRPRRHPLLAAADHSRTGWRWRVAVHGGHRHAAAGRLRPGHRVRVRPGRARLPRLVSARLAGGRFARAAGPVPGTVAVQHPRLIRSSPDLDALISAEPAQLSPIQRPHFGRNRAAIMEVSREVPAWPPRGPRPSPVTWAPWAAESVDTNVCDD